MKKKIVIASILKPVDDIRAYKKIAQSIVKANKYEVNIIGNGGKKESEDERITFHSHSLFSNSTTRRLLTRGILFIKILKLQPQLLIITTHELLNVSLLIKLLTRCKVVYDVQEDYVANTRHINPNIFKIMVGWFITIKESLSKIYVAEYWLAERCYAYQLSFVKNKFLIVENKAKEVLQSRKEIEGIKLLFSGTISNYGGVKNAILLLEKIQEKHPSASLKIIGQIHDTELEKQLLESQKNNQTIELNISRNSISHDRIVDAIYSCNLGVIGYEENEVNRKKTPTKLYEYSRYQLPYVVLENTLWSKLGSQLGGSIPMNFRDPNVDGIVYFAENTDQLFANIYPEEETWEHESEKIITSIDTLLDSK